MKYLIKQSAHWSTKNWLLIYKIICYFFIWTGQLDYIGIDSRENKLLFFKPEADLDEALVIRKPLLKRYSFRYGTWTSIAHTDILGFILLYTPVVNSQSLDNVQLNWPTWKMPQKLNWLLLKTVLNLWENELNSKLKHQKSKTSVISRRIGDSYRRFGNLCHTNHIHISGRPIDNLCLK